ncbi:hypothetical protein LTR17_000063 [Elasticomyces elasticus]|nr:hypothetical protein LTR17_000063 [Elasticomyces elasticus]
MFRWYNAARICYVLLSDFGWPNYQAATSTGVITSKQKLQLARTNFLVCVATLKRCRWFSRGWCLQELIAPEDVRFYNKDWVLFSTRHELADQLAEVTGIDGSMLDWPRIYRINQLKGASVLPDSPRAPKGMSELREALSDFSIAQRMSWASQRQTSRLEDVAYSLLGIFDINMTLLYGEGDNAFIRLQEEIIKQSTDHSILAWEYSTSPSRRITRRWGLLAEHPNNFSTSNNVLATDYHRERPAKAGFDLSNQGLRITLPVICRPEEDQDWALLDCSLLDDLSGPLALCLWKTKAINVYETRGYAKTSRTESLPREIIHAAVDTAITIVPGVRWSASRLTDASIGGFRVNVFDRTKTARVFETWPPASVRKHSELPTDAASRELDYPDATITLPHLLTTAIGHGVRIKLWSDPDDIWEAFYDLIVCRMGWRAWRAAELHSFESLPRSDSWRLPDAMSLSGRMFDRAGGSSSDKASRLWGCDVYRSYGHETAATHQARETSRWTQFLEKLAA